MKRRDTRNTQLPESRKLVLDDDDNDDDDYTPSTPTRGNHSIYHTLALQGKAISPSSSLFLVRPALLRCPTHISHNLALSSIL